MEQRDHSKINSLIEKALPLDYDKLEKLMLKEDQVDCPVIHRFGPGLYMREAFMPAGAYVIGHAHKTEHTSILLKGKIRLFDDNGVPSDLTAPAIMCCKKGRKTAYIIEDVVWLNIHSTEETDIETLENLLLDKTPLKKEIKHIDRTADREDYKKALSEYDFSPAHAKIISDNLLDRIDFPYGGYPVMISDSEIEGKGLFATANIKAGQVIAPGRIGVFRTPAGVYTNHSICPNARFEIEGKNFILKAIKDIHGNSGGLKGEEITVNYREALSLQIGGVTCQQ